MGYMRPGGRAGTAYPRSGLVGNMAAPRPGIPASLRAPASAWESKPLLINDPDDDANALVISSGVSDIVGVYVPVGRKGLAGQGAVTEGDADAGAVQLLYHFLLMVGWLEQPVWKPRGAVLVLRRPRGADESVECYRADGDAVTGLVFLAHSAPVEYPKPKKRGGGGYDEAADDEVDLRTLPQQMNLNAAEHFRLATHASPIALMGGGPPASKRARGAVDLSGVFHPTLEAKGIHMLTIDGPSAFDKASQYLFPTLRHSTRSSLAESPACTWSLPSLLSRVRRCHHGGGQVVDFFEETFSEVSSVRLRSGQPNEEVDVYVVERAFWKINSSFMTVIPRAFRPPLEPALILRYYAMLHHYNPVSRPFCFFYAFVATHSWLDSTQRTQHRWATTFCWTKRARMTRFTTRRSGRRTGTRSRSRRILSRPACRLTSRR